MNVPQMSADVANRIQTIFIKKKHYKITTKGSHWCCYGHECSCEGEGINVKSQTN